MEPVRDEIADFPKQPGCSNMCGAYALAYWDAMLPFTVPPKKEIVNKAEEYYGKIQFTTEDFIPGESCDEGRLRQYPEQCRDDVRTIMGIVVERCLGEAGNSYCNPQKMMGQIGECSFYLGCDPMIWAVYVKLKTINEKIETVGFPPESTSDMLEIVKTEDGGGLHYLYTFMEGGVRRAIDPARGFNGERKKILPREKVIAAGHYQVTNAAIVIG